MKDAYYDEENSCLSMVSSEEDGCGGVGGGDEHVRARSRSSNRTLTSTSSNDIQSDELYDEESRSSSPEVFEQSESQQQQQQNQNENKKKEFKIKHHSTPLVEHQQQQQQHKQHHQHFQQQQQKMFPLIQHQQQQQHLLPAFNSPNPMLSALQFVHNHMNIQTEQPHTPRQIPTQHQQQQQQQQHKPLSLCAVCGDRASGKHYGVLSCDGCRGFFKRSIRGNMEYVCKESQKCIIDVSRRNQCQACRLKKCLEVKMNRDAVQHQRPPRSHQIRRDSSLTTTTHTTINAPSPVSASSQCITKQVSTPNGNGSSFYSNRFSPYSLPPLYSTATWNQQTSATSPSTVQQQQQPPLPQASIPLVPPNSAFNRFSPSFHFNNAAAAAVFQRQVAAVAAAAAAQQQAHMNANHNNNNNTNAADSFTVSNTSPNISTTSSGYSTAEDSGVHDESKDCSKIKKESNESSLPLPLTPTKTILEATTTTQKSPKKEKQHLPTDLSIANLIKPSTPSPQQQTTAQQQAAIINWNQMVVPTDNVYEMATRILFSSVKWARTQRSFLSLPFSDQAVLLEDGWSDLFILTAAETKLISNESLLLLSMNETNAERKKLIQNFSDTLQRLSTARIDAMEYYLLKSIIIYKSEIKEIREKIKVDAIQEECLNALLNHTKTNYASTIRHGRLLLLISDLRKFGSKIIEDLFFKHFLGNNTIDNLLFDIFKSC